MLASSCFPSWRWQKIGLGQCVITLRSNLILELLLKLRVIVDCRRVERANCLNWMRAQYCSRRGPNLTSRGKILTHGATEFHHIVRRACHWSVVGNWLRPKRQSVPWRWRQGLQEIIGCFVITAFALRRRSRCHNLSSWSRRGWLWSIEMFKKRWIRSSIIYVVRVCCCTKSMNWWRK